MIDPMCAVRAAAQELRMKPRMILVGGVQGECEADLAGPASSMWSTLVRQIAIPFWLSSKRPAVDWHMAFDQGCGGLGPGGEGRAHRICDLMSAESLSGRPRGLLHDRRHHHELEVHEKSTAAVTAMTAAIGAAKARIRLPTAEPPAAISSHGLHTSVHRTRWMRSKA